MSNLIIRNHQAFIEDYSCPVFFGKNGFTTDKKEGDLKTPIGTFHLGPLYYRADRLSTPKTQLKCLEITPRMGWCDDPLSPFYNRLIELPFASSHEELWREDHLYDIVIEIKYNQNPVIPEKGSAIFIHLKRKDFTAGCLSFHPKDLITLLEYLSPDSNVIIEGSIIS